MLALAYSYKPFFTAMPLWGYEYVMLPVVCLAVAIVYKTMKVKDTSTLAWEAFKLFLWIQLGMIGVAAGLLILVSFVEMP